MAAQMGHVPSLLRAPPLDACFAAADCSATPTVVVGVIVESVVIVVVPTSDECCDGETEVGTVLLPEELAASPAPITVPFP